MAQDCDRTTDQWRPTDRQTDRATASVTIVHVYIVVRCGLIISCAIL